VKKVVGATTTRYIFSGTKVIAEYVNGAAVGSPTREYIYTGSRLLATIQSGTTTYHHQDHLSVRVNTNASGTKIGEQGHFSFGESWYSVSTTTKWQFTSYERDSESVLDYAMFRYQNARLGRFMTPDPLALLTSCTGPKLTLRPFDPATQTPQEANLYSYVANDPINRTDPMGLTLHPILFPIDHYGGMEPIGGGGPFGPIEGGGAGFGPFGWFDSFPDPFDPCTLCMESCSLERIACMTRCGEQAVLTAGVNILIGMLHPLIGSPPVEFDYEACVGRCGEEEGRCLSSCRWAGGDCSDLPPE
jgi:RHS repeat-associated protein